MPQARDVVRVAYLVSQYPALSHTFIEREIAGLRERGVEVHTFTIRPCPAGELLSVDMRAEAARTPSIVGTPRARIAAAQARLARRAPHVYASLLRRALRTGPATARGRLWQGFYFVEAVILWAALCDLGVRHVHVHMANVSADVARLATAIGAAVDGPDVGWGWSLTVHGPGEFDQLEQWDVPDKLRSARAVAPISDYCRSQLMRLVEPEHWSKMTVVRMSVDAERFVPPAALRGEPERAAPPLRLLYVGRLVPEKGGLVLLEALALLRDSGVAVTSRVVGAGPLADDLVEQARAWGVAEAVTFVGPVGQGEILAEYHWADVFVLPSFAEGLPVVLMEAMATGLPVVTTQIAAVSELVEDGAMGRVLPAGRADLLAEAIARLAADPAGRRAMGARGRAAVLDRFTPATTSPAMVDFLTRASAPTRAGIAGA